MTGIGLFLVFLGYTTVYWGVNALQRKDQDSFASYLFPFVPAKSAPVPKPPTGVKGPIGTPGG